jgi:LuxR family maltose regulon positive regulatory protein
VGDDLTYLAEYDHITLARLMLAEGTNPSSLLDRLLVRAEAGGRVGVAIELLVLKSLAAQRHGEDAQAAEAIEHAIEFAEPEGLIGVFADEGAAIVPLLEAVAARSGGSPYIRRLLSAVGRGRPEPAHAVISSPDDLSGREREVLRLLASDLSGPGIARHLVVSVNTLRTHTKNIYAKLGVTSRREAVTRAVELGLLNSTR